MRFKVFDHPQFADVKVGDRFVAHVMVTEIAAERIDISTYDAGDRIALGRHIVTFDVDQIEAEKAQHGTA